MDKSSTATQLKSLRSQHGATLAELEQYKRLVDNVQDYAIFLMDPHGYVVTWNKGAELNKGYKPKEIIGKHFSSFYLPKDKDAKKPERELEVAKKFGRVEDEDWRVRKDGSKFWANVVITALYDEDGTLSGFAKVTRDLTERKQQEDALRKANTLLKNQQHELEQINSYKDEFISLASHQLRTPATAIKQLLGLLLEGFAGEVPLDQKTIIKKAYASNERQINIVNNLLKVAQIDAGKVMLHKIPTDTLPIVNDVVEGHKNAFRKRNQTVTIDADDNLPLVSLDPAYFRMAVENIVDNATKYTRHGGTIKLAVRQRKNHVAIIIKDNGVGIAEKDMHKLFGKFTRIPNELSDNVGGSGLGLYWVNKVIQLHGGSIEVQSELGHGTTFTTRMPTGRTDA